MRHALILFVAMVLALTVPGLAADAPTGSEYSVIKKVKVGGAGGFDYVFADSAGRRLYIPRSAGRGGGAGVSRVTVFDLDTLVPVGEIPNTIGVHGVAVDPQSGHGFCSSNPVVMFDTKTLATLKTIHVDGSPDGIFLEPATERIFVLSHRAPNVSVLDAKDGSLVGTIDLGGAPEQGQSDGNGHVFIDIEDRDQIAAVDANTMKVTAHFDLAGKGGGPGGLGLDAANHILFAFCHNPQTCVVLNSVDGSILTTLPIGNGVDAGGFNPNTMEAFCSTGDGKLTFIKENSPTSFEIEQNLITMRAAKTSTLDSKTNQIFLIAAEYAAPTSQPTTSSFAAGGRRGSRGQMVPGSFTILCVGK